MIRTQVQLTEEQLEAVRRLAAERGLSVAALIREGVERVVAEAAAEDRRARALAAVGGYASGGANASEQHDRYLGDAFVG